MAYQHTTLRGNLGSEPEVREISADNKVTNIAIAVGEKWKDKQSGEMKEHTEWFRCSAFGYEGQNIAKYFSKGDSILVWGKHRTRKYQDPKTGEDRYATNFIIQGFDFPANKSGGESGNAGGAPAAKQQAAPQPAGAEFDDDIPF